MSLLNNLPHTATAQRRKRTVDAHGGSIDTFTPLFSDRACWQQQARESEITEFDKRGISVTDKVYFTTNPNVDERDILTITNSDAGVTATFEVRSRAKPDASAGKGIVFRVYCEETTTGSTD